MLTKADSNFVFTDGTRSWSQYRESKPRSIQECRVGPGNR